MPPLMNYIRNEQLETVLPGWKGNPLDADGRFVNAHQPFKASFSKVLRWQLTRNPQKAEKVGESWKLRVRTDGDFLNEKEKMLAWLGHATFLIRLEGVTLLTDPVFFRASPLVRRLCELPVPVSQLQGIDYVLLSHGHMDHCDEKSLRLLANGNPQMEVLTGLKMDSLIAPWLPGLRIQQAGWYQEYQLGQTGIRIFFLPARHWYKRTWNDDNRRLWGSFVIQTPRLTLYFSGDTGYDSHFQETARLFPQPDICLMGVGAYSPAFMMQENHMNPEEAVRGFNEMGGKTFIPMHYGTYDLSDEPLGEPVRWLQKLEKEGKINGRMKLLDVGEVYKL
jgi:L-ascorbate metabolism protein UlaG (beta-lactamase superfamily)